MSWESSSTPTRTCQTVGSRYETCSSILGTRECLTSLRRMELFSTRLPKRFCPEQASGHHFPLSRCKRGGGRRACFLVEALVLFSIAERAAARRATRSAPADLPLLPATRSLGRRAGRNHPPRGSVSRLLPVQPLPLHAGGQHPLGPRGQPRPGALGAAADRAGALSRACRPVQISGRVGGGAHPRPHRDADHPQRPHMLLQRLRGGERRRPDHRLHPLHPRAAGRAGHARPRPVHRHQRRRHADLDEASRSGDRSAARGARPPCPARSAHPLDGARPQR